PGWGLGDIPYCLKVGKGNCTDFHTLFIALARATGIPARWNMGFPVAYGDGKADTGDQTVAGYHCWAEFYAPGAGWVPVDISEARKHPELKAYFFGGLSGNRVLFTRARDALLEPDRTGRRLNYFIYPVARADGQEVSSEWTLRYTDEPSALRAAEARYVLLSTRYASWAVAALRASAATRALKPRDRYAENCGIAIAARMPMIATTTSNSINVKPLDRLRPAFCECMDSSSFW